jgi:adenylate kinase
MDLVFLGKPGAGKGTIARILQEKGFKQLSTGDLLRKEVKEKTPLGLKVGKIMAEGKLVDDEIITELLKKNIVNISKSTGIIFDGCPRTINQAKALDKILKELNRKISFAINFNVSDDIIIERISGRRTCPKCQKIYHIKNFPPKVNGKCDECGSNLIQRSDESVETIKKRLKEFELKTKPILDYYNSKGLLKTIDASKSVKEILKELEKILKCF